MYKMVPIQLIFESKHGNAIAVKLREE